MGKVRLEDTFPLFVVGLEPFLSLMVPESQLALLGVLVHEELVFRVDFPVEVTRLVLYALIDQCDFEIVLAHQFPGFGHGPDEEEGHLQPQHDPDPQ